MCKLPNRTRVALSSTIHKCLLKVMSYAYDSWLSSYSLDHEELKVHTVFGFVKVATKSSDNIESLPKTVLWKASVNEFVQIVRKDGVYDKCFIFAIVFRLTFSSCLFYILNNEKTSSQIIQNSSSMRHYKEFNPVSYFISIFTARFLEFGASWNDSRL